MTKSNAKVLTFDFGTQSVRAMIFDELGNILASERVSFKPYFSLKPGWAEQHTELYWEKFCEVSKKLKENNEEFWKELTAVSVTTFRDTAVCLDKERKPLRAAILWLDQREIDDVGKRISPGKTAMFKLVNMFDTAQMQCRASVCNWVHDNEPELFEKIDKYVMFSCYLNYLLTGNLVDSVASQIGHIPFDYKNRRWQTAQGQTASLFDVKEHQMPDIVEPSELIGHITNEASGETGIPAGLPLIATGSDKGCETLGSGAIGTDAASLSFGTAATVQITTKRYVEPLPFVPAYPAVIKGQYNPEVQIFRGYWMLSWFKREFAEKEEREAKKRGVNAESLLNERLREIPVGCDGLVLQPYWTPGLKTPNARGAIIGFSDVHTRVHIYRAIIEGLGFALYDGLKAMEKRAGHKVERILVSGGAAQSEEICQITANLFGLTVQRAQTYETSSLGAAITAFTGLGVYSNFEEAVKNMVRIEKEYIPDMQIHKIYNEIYQNVYKQIYSHNKDLYKEINKISHKYR